MKVDIVQLPPMRVASVHVINETPERDAWVKLRKWAIPTDRLTIATSIPFRFQQP